MSLCSVEGCTRPHCARGYCNTHYAQWRRRGDPLFRKPSRACSLSGCAGPHYARGYCHLHWKRWRTYGDPTMTRRQDAQLNPNWKGDAVGYGGLHKWMRANFDPIPCEHCGALRTGRNMEWALKHGCVANRERSNWLRLCSTCHRTYDGNGRWNRAKTECPHGHPYDEENTYWHRGKRGCLTCMRAGNRQRSRERAEARALARPA